MATLRVRKDGSGDYLDIQAAIYDAVNGDIVDIGPGTFNEAIEINKTITIKGAGKDLTIIQGKYGTDVVAGCSYYSNEDIITMPSTSGMIKGRPVSGTSFPTGARILQVISGTQIRLSGLVTGAFTRVASASYPAGSTTVVINATGTNPAAGNRMYAGTTLLGTVSAFNTTTRAITLSSGITQAIASGATLTFGALRSAQSVTQASLFPGCYGYGTAQVTNANTTGFQLKDLQVIGYDLPTPGIEGAAITLSSSTAPGHQNFLIDNCKFVAAGEGAVLSSTNHYFSNSTFQNCVFEGKTFTGSEPAYVQGFSSFPASGTVQSVGASTSVIMLDNAAGIIVGSTLTSTSFSGTGSVTAISGSSITINKVVTVAAGGAIACTFTNIQFTVPNVARQLVCFGNSSSVVNTVNTTFKNNLIKGQTGAVISANGAKTMFNTAVTIDTVGGLIEGNTIDGNFGAGEPNSLYANFAIRARGANTVVKNNVDNVIGGRGNSGFYVPGAGSTNENNVIIESELVATTPAVPGESLAATMSKAQVKTFEPVYSHPTLSDDTTWRQVGYVFKKDGSSKRLIASFISFGVLDTSKISLKNATSGEVYKLHKIIVRDSSRVLAVVKRSQIVGASAYDITIA